MSKTAIVFGATGLTGSRLLFELLEHNEFEKIKVFARNQIPISSPKLEQIVMADFDKLDEFSSSFKADVIFCCLGTTIKKAGSPEAFQRVDYTYPVAIAQIAQNQNVGAFVMISSIGADSKSSYLYLRTKGLAEEQVRQVFSGKLKIFRPSVLMGHRREFRPGEEIGKFITKLFSFLMIGAARKYRGIDAATVAKAMIKALDTPDEKLVFESDEIQQMMEGSQTKISPYAVK